MVLSSIVGSLGFIGSVLTLLAGIVTPEIAQNIAFILTILGYIAGGGGFTVIVGAFIAGYGPDRIGRIIIGFGIGTSLFGLISILVINLFNGVTLDNIIEIFLGTFNGVYGLTGVILSIFSRMRLKD
ncbi:MAG: hypothetical protein ACTSV5_08435 [Promethearchaeota archaeon]